MITKRDSLTIVIILAIGVVLIAVAFSRGNPSAQDGLGHTVPLPAEPVPPRN